MVINIGNLRSLFSSLPVVASVRKILFLYGQLMFTMQTAAECRPCSSFLTLDLFLLLYEKHLTAIFKKFC